MNLMTEQEIQEYNKRCMEFVGWKLHSKHSKFLYYHEDRPREAIVDYRSMQFHSDWNLIMKVFKVIEEFSIMYNNASLAASSGLEKNLSCFGS